MESFSLPKYWRKLRIKPKLLSSTKLNKMNFNKLYGFLSVKKFESGEIRRLWNEREWSPQLSSIKLNQLRRKHPGQDPLLHNWQFLKTVHWSILGWYWIRVVVWLFRANLVNRWWLVQRCDCEVHSVVVILIIKLLYTSFPPPAQDRTDTHSQTWHIAHHHHSR